MSHAQPAHNQLAIHYNTIGTCISLRYSIVGAAALTLQKQLSSSGQRGTLQSRIHSLEAEQQLLPSSCPVQTADSELTGTSSATVCAVLRATQPLPPYAQLQLNLDPLRNQPLTRKMVLALIPTQQYQRTETQHNFAHRPLSVRSASHPPPTHTRPHSSPSRAHVSASHRAQF